MNEEKRTIKIGKEEFSLVFTLNAYLEVVRQYGGYAQLMKALGIGPKEEDDDDGQKKPDKNDPAGKAEISENIAWLISVMANQGIEIYNEFEREEKAPKRRKITQTYVLLKMSPFEFAKAKPLILDALVSGMTGKIDSSEEQDEVLDEIKNAEGATIPN